jgi:nitrogen fixation/metabolism regulation signal transduction histidine kinase
MFIVSLIIILQIVNLVRYVEKTNQYLNRFFDAIKHSDFSQSFSIEGLGSSFDELRKSFMDVILAFRKSRSEKEEQYRYLQTVVKHVGIGLIAFRKDGEVELINTAVKKLFRINQLKNIKSLESFSPELVKHLFQLRPRKSTLLKIYHADELLQLAIYATEFKLSGEQITLVSFQNIQGELEEQEMEAWQQLIRVLTHEIMNSITPISSLAKTVDQLLGRIITDDDQKDDLKEIQRAMSTIQKRSEGLIHFVESYRQLTRIPKPNFQMISVNNIFKRVTQLMENELNTRKIVFSSKVIPENLHVIADQELIEQVLLNLIRNSLDALAVVNNGQLSLESALDERGRVVIRVTDNGTGIIPEAQDKIFIPFYTTKKSGSGIGLSLSRQIMRQHTGSISVTSIPEKETTFKLTFS